MSLTRKRIPVTTASDGTFTTEIHMQGAVRCVAVDLGDGPTALSTPDITITDTFDDSDVFAVAAVASNGKYYPTTDDLDSADGESFASPVIVQRATVEVAGGGDTKSGTITVFLER